MSIKTVISILCLFLTSCSGDGASVAAPEDSVAATTELIGAPLVTIPSVADENRIKLSFSSKVKLAISDIRTDTLGLGATPLRLAGEPLFGIRFALEKTLRSLGYKLGDDGTVALTGQVLRFELLPSKTAEVSQAYVRITFTVTDPLGSTLLQRDYEGSSGSTGTPEQKLGAAISDILSQISIDKELQTVLASF